ncbi:single-stranded DNA-binding protein [bacterium]|nr:single-stranded DNA-binding protein [Actinomycetota bacterium]MBE32582.1 single-stranded DNA-binding protein [bacterium]|tara:strand:+ start:1265 stop:1627 length:363 start_codon:yes stop_codon:yes gene_type:complete
MYHFKMFNKSVLIGRLVRDPESRVTSSGISFARFTIAIDRIGGNADNKVTDFINIVAWRRLAEIATQFLKKGKLVAVEGALRIDEYEKEGQTREWVEVVADNFQMLDRSTDAPSTENEIN